MKPSSQRNPLYLASAVMCAIVVALGSFFSPVGASQPEASADAPGEEASAQGDEAAEGEASAVRSRETEEKEFRLGFFAIAPHRQNYILPLTYNFAPNTKAYEFADEDEPKNLEVKYQLSFKLLLWEKMFWGNGDLYFAYTQLSFWQLYDDALSSPFRETNYEPEVFLKFDTDLKLLGFNLRLFTLGFNHESNGRGGDLSRSWNRIFAVFLAERGKLLIGLKPWYRIPEDDEDDDNPDAEKYMGYGEMFGVYRLRGHVFSFMLRNNFRVDNNLGAVELGWSYGITKNVRIYSQYFFGYGESLLDYNHESNRIGCGLMLNDWL